MPPDPYALLTPRELADLAEAATRRGYAEVARDLRSRNNAEVRADVMRMERDAERSRAEQTIAQMSDVTAALRRLRRRALYTIGTVLLALVGVVANRLTVNDVETTAETKAAEVVEQRAAPIEQRADEAAEAAKAAADRQAALERRESERDAQLERLIRALEAERAAPPKGKGHK